MLLCTPEGCRGINSLINIIKCKPHYCKNLQLYSKAHHKLFFLCCAQLLHIHAVHLLVHIAFIVDIYVEYEKQTNNIDFRSCFQHLLTSG